MKRRNWICLLTEEEAKALLHKAKVDLARWSEEEPEAKDRAVAALGYWSQVINSRLTPGVVEEVSAH